MLSDGCEIILVPASKKRKRRKLSYFFHLENQRKRLQREKASNAESLESKYYIVRDLGSGAFSTVKLATHRATKKHFALKIIDRHSWQRMKQATKRDVCLLDEVAIMQKAKHAHIVKVHEYFEEEKVVNVVLDYCVGGDMLEFIQQNGAYHSAKARRLFAQMISAIDYLHRDLKVAHRDLKPDNILLADEAGEVLKISDFGIPR